VGEHVRIRVPVQAEVGVDPDPAQNERTPTDEPVDVISETDSELQRPAALLKDPETGVMGELVPRGGPPQWQLLQLVLEQPEQDEPPPPVEGAE